MIFYLIFTINIIAFTVTGFDKYQAVNNKYRIQEKKLFFQRYLLLFLCIGFGSLFLYYGIIVLFNIYYPLNFID